MRVHELDVTSDASVAACIAAAGELDAIVNNAALVGAGPLDDYPLDQFQRVLDTNTTGPLRMVQAVAPAWRARGTGVIVNVSSVQGRVATPLEGPYAASKYALEALSETLHYELGHFGIRIVIIEPGYIAPGMKHSDDHRGHAGLRRALDPVDRYRFEADRPRRTPRPGTRRSRDRRRDRR